VKLKNTEEKTMNEKKEQMYIVRCDRAGVFFGAIKARRGAEATMVSAHAPAIAEVPAHVEKRDGR
jgi:hypothetical protein